MPLPTPHHALFESDDFAQTFVDLHRAARAGTARAAVTREVPGVREVAPLVYAVPMLEPERCVRLLAEIDARRAAVRAGGGVLVTPNSMHEHGVVLDELGLGAVLDDLAQRWIAPVANALFAPFVERGIDTQHGYLVEYAADADEELGFHVDDSEVTLNLCLGEDFDGAELVLLGLRCDAHRQTPVKGGEVVEIEHVVGTAILHAGRHRHRVDPIRRGRRRNLILWCRDGSARREGRAGRCGEWCGFGGGAGD